jgi:hypothetical protein
MDFLLTRFLAASSMSGKLAEAERIEWRVWYFLHSRKWMNCLEAVGLFNVGLPCGRQNNP